MAKTSKRELSDRAETIYQRLTKLHQDSRIELNFSNPLELMVATILSAQCTDIRVNQVTAVLFRRCKTLKDYQNIPQDELESIIHSAGFYRQKAKNIRAAAQMIAESYGGEVPQNIDDLIKLPGVGRKTANVILGNTFGIPGLPVDTHVKRVSNRLGLTRHEDPVKIEQDLNALIPPKDWTMFSHTLIFHGRRVCSARKPNCPACPVSDLCRYYGSKDGKG